MFITWSNITSYYKQARVQEVNHKFATTYVMLRLGGKQLMTNVYFSIISYWSTINFQHKSLPELVGYWVSTWLSGWLLITYQSVIDFVDNWLNWYWILKNLITYLDDLIIIQVGYQSLNINTQKKKKKEILFLVLLKK